MRLVTGKGKGGSEIKLHWEKPDSWVGGGPESESECEWVTWICEVISEWKQMSWKSECSSLLWQKTLLGEGITKEISFSQPPRPPPKKTTHQNTLHPQTTSYNGEERGTFSSPVVRWLCIWEQWLHLPFYYFLNRNTYNYYLMPAQPLYFRGVGSRLTWPFSSTGHNDILIVLQTLLVLADACKRTQG